MNKLLNDRGRNKIPTPWNENLANRKMKNSRRATTRFWIIAAQGKVYGLLARRKAPSLLRALSLSRGRAHPASRPYSLSSLNAWFQVPARAP